MDLPGSVQYRGKKVYLNRKTLLQTGRWKWVQEATGLERGEEVTARNLLHEWNLHELAKDELRAMVLQRKSVGAEFSPEPTLREFAKQWVEHRKAHGLTSAF